MWGKPPGLPWAFWSASGGGARVRNAAYFSAEIVGQVGNPRRVANQAITSSLMPLGQTASHSPTLVQLSNSSAPACIRTKAAHPSRLGAQTERVSNFRAFVLRWSWLPGGRV